MANQSTYPRIYQFNLLTKAWRSLIALLLIALGAATFAAVRNEVRWLDTGLVGTLEISGTFGTLFAGLFFALTRQINGWVRLLVCLAYAAPLAVDFCTQPLNTTPHFPINYPPALASGVALCLMGLYYLVTTLNGRLVLQASHLEYRFFVKARRMSYSDILSTFGFHQALFSEATIALRLKNAKPLIIGTFGRADDALLDWLDSLPNEEHEAEVKARQDWLDRPVFPRIYQYGPWTKAGLSLMALLVCALGMAGIGIPDAILTTKNYLVACAVMAPLIMILTVVSEPRFNNALKTVWAVAYLAPFPALLLADGNEAIRGISLTAVPFIRVFGGLCLVYGLFLLVANLRARMVLHEDYLDYRAFLTTRKIAFADIVQTFDTGSGNPFCFSLRFKNGKSHRVVRFGLGDPAFTEWINRFPNREIEEEDREWERLRSDSELGPNPDSRIAAFRRDVKWLNWLWWPRIALYGWALIYPRPYEVCMYVMLAVPIVTLLFVLTNRKRWSMHTDGSAYPLGIGFNLAGGAALALGMRAYFDHNMVHWITPLACGAIIAPVLMLVVCLLEGRFPWKALAGAYLVYAVYAWGGLMFLNVALDNHRGKIESVTVVRIHEDSKYPRVTVLRANGKTLTYKGRLGRKGKVGDTICLYTLQGAFGWKDYTGGKCPTEKVNPAKS